MQVFRPIEEALEQNHFFVSAFYKGTTLITKHCLELISLKHSEIRILIGNGYKAIYAFSFNHYDYWKDVLDDPNLLNGAFGENFTVSNLCEDTIKIGDQFRFGTALLEVSQPRVPCFKLGIALNNRHAVKLFTKNYCTGAYFRVIEPGVVKTGDTVFIKKRCTHNISIKNLFQAYFDRSYVGSESLFAEVLALKALAPEWKEKLVKRLSVKSE